MSRSFQLRSRFVLCALVGSLSSLGSAAEPAYRLRYDFTKMPAVHYRVVQRAQIVTEKGEIKDVTLTSEQTDKHFRVIGVDNAGVALLESRIDRANMAVQFDETDPIRWNSDGKADPPKQFRDVASKVGKPLARMRVSARGELLSMSRIGAKPVAADNLKKLDAAENVLVEFPEAPIRVGDSWRQHFEVDVNVTNTVTRPAKMVRTFTLEKVEKGIATIGYKISVVSPVVDPTISIQLIMKTPSGTVQFDTNRGQIVSRSQSIDEVVFGPFGAGSTMSASSQRSERLIDPKRAVKAVARNN